MNRWVLIAGCNCCLLWTLLLDPVLGVKVAVWIGKTVPPVLLCVALMDIGEAFDRHKFEVERLSFLDWAYATTTAVLCVIGLLQGFPWLELWIFKMGMLLYIIIYALVYIRNNVFVDDFRLHIFSKLKGWGVKKIGVHPRDYVQ